MCQNIAHNKINLSEANHFPKHESIRHNLGAHTLKISLSVLKAVHQRIPVVLTTSTI